MRQERGQATVTIPLAVGVDGSEASLAAVDWAADEASRHGVPLHLLHAAAGEQEASAVIRASSARAREGAPAVRLSSEVSQEDASTADLLVVGARRRRGHPGLQLGLVNHALLHPAPGPVAVVPQI
jgi:nucleotide-binding universal stress UspA family protein